MVPLRAGPPSLAPAASRVHGDGVGDPGRQRHRTRASRSGSAAAGRPDDGPGRAARRAAPERSL